MFRSILIMVIAVALASFFASSLLVDRSAQPKLLHAILDLMPRRPAANAPAPAQSADDTGPGANRPATGGSAQIAIAPDRSGNYLTDVEIEGHFIHMMVDTGATYVSLTHEDASALGIRPAPVDFKYRTMTANGTGVAAKVMIGTLRLGQMEVYDVEAFVMPPGALGTSLLGMSALRRLGSVEISGGQLVLRQ